MPVCTFVDFDDTIFPTTDSHAVHPLDYRVDLERIDSLVACFVLYHQHQTLFRIVTAAEDEWVRSCLDQLPQLRAHVQAGVVPVYTCRNHSKTETVQRLMQREGIARHYMTIGDSLDEMSMVQRALAASNCHRNVYGIRFKSSPSRADIIRQWVEINALFGRYVDL
jgi:hypothetical protein